MNISMEVEKTTFITVNGTMVKVSSLPEAIKYEIATLDRMRQDHTDAAYRYEVSGLALKAKQAHITQIVNAHYGAKEEASGEAGE